MSTANDRTMPEGKSALLRTSEAAEFLRLSTSTLNRIRGTGQGPRFIKLGPGSRARVVYRIEDLDAWVRAHQRGNTSEKGGRE